MKKSIDPNAKRALEHMKQEIGNELGVANNLKNGNSIDNIFTAGPVGGLMTRKLVEMGEEQLIDKELDK